MHSLQKIVLDSVMLTLLSFSWELLQLCKLCPPLKFLLLPILNLMNNPCPLLDIFFLYLRCLILCEHYLDVLDRCSPLEVDGWASYLFIYDLL